jgi:hypothetical protein
MFHDSKSYSHFFTLFRMDYRTFKHVLDMTEHDMQRRYLQSERAGGYVSPEAQLAFTIRWLAGGSYLDISDHYGVSKPTFYRLVYECIDLIIDAFPISFPVSSMEALGSLAADFVAKQINFHDCRRGPSTGFLSKSGAQVHMSAMVHRTTGAASFILP